MSEEHAKEIYESMRFDLERFKESGNRYYIKTLTNNDLPGDSNLSDGDLTSVINKIYSDYNLELVSLSKNSSTFSAIEYTLSFSRL